MLIKKCLFIKHSLAVFVIPIVKKELHDMQGCALSTLTSQAPLQMQNITKQTKKEFYDVSEKTFENNRDNEK